MEPSPPDEEAAPGVASMLAPNSDAGGSAMCSARPHAAAASMAARHSAGVSAPSGRGMRGTACSASTGRRKVAEPGAVPAVETPGGGAQTAAAKRCEFEKEAASSNWSGSGGAAAAAATAPASAGLSLARRSCVATTADADDSTMASAPAVDT